MSSMQDARQRTKTWLDEHINSNYITEDDGVTKAKFITAFADPDYPLIRVFYDKYVDVVFTVGTPNSEALPVGVGYIEHVPIKIWTVDKLGSITGTKLRWTVEKELRRVTEEYPTGSLRTLDRVRDNEQRLGSTVLYSVEFILEHKRYS